MKNLQALAREHHIALSIVSPNRHGTISPDAILAACQPNTQLVSCIFASNETGILQPIHAIAKALQTRGIPMHTDATQAIGKTQIDLNDLPVDMLSFSGHKLGAPFGIGALYVRAPHLLQTCFVDPLTTQYTHYHHPAAISALAAALKHQHHPKPNPRDAFEQQLAQHHAIRMLVAGQNQPRLYNTSCIRFVGIPATALLMRLDLKHIYASAGSACHSGIVSPSSVLLSMGFTQAEALETIRFSFPPQFSPNHVHTLVEHIVRECHAIQYHHAPSP
jgi:cysteine desulfurase